MSSGSNNDGNNEENNDTEQPNIDSQTSSNESKPAEEGGETEESTNTDSGDPLKQSKSAFEEIINPLKDIFQNSKKDESKTEGESEKQEENTTKPAPMTIKELFELLQNPLEKLEAKLPLKIWQLIFVVSTFILPLLFWSLNVLQFIFVGYVCYVIYKIQQQKERLNLSATESSQFDLAHKIGLGGGGFSLLVLFVGGPENILVPSEFRGTWYHPTTCQEINIGYRGVSQENIWIYQPLKENPKPSHESKWNVEYKNQSADTLQSVNKKTNSIKELDLERAKMSLELEKNSWVQKNFDLSLSGGIAFGHSVDYEKIVTPLGTCSGKMRIDQSTIIFDFTQGSGCVSYRFVQEKPTTCIEKPIEDLQVKVQENEKNINTLYSEINSEIEADKIVRAKAGSKATVDEYPHPCNNVDPELHHSIEGNEKSCMPTSFSAYLDKIELGSTIKLPYSFDDSNPLSFLISPYSSQANNIEDGPEESSKFTKEEQKVKAKEVKNSYYMTEIRSSDCEVKFADSTNTITFSQCEFEEDQIYASGDAYVHRTQKCETDCYRPGSCGLCSSHSDCSGWTCGCSESRCTRFGYCTDCPSSCDKTCEEPEFTLKGVNKYSFSKKLEQEDYDALKNHLDSNNIKLQVVFNPVSAYRKVFTKNKSYSEGKEEEYTTSFYLKAAPKVIWTKTPNVILLLSQKTFSFDVGNIVVSCKNDICSSKVK